MAFISTVYCLDTATGNTATSSTSVTSLRLMMRSDNYFLLFAFNNDSLERLLYSHNFAREMIKFENCSRKKCPVQLYISVGFFTGKVLICRPFCCLFSHCGKREALYNYTTDKFAGSNMSSRVLKCRSIERTSQRSNGFRYVKLMSPFAMFVRFSLLLKRKQQQCR